MSKHNSGYIQEPPFAVQIESVEGCTLRCPFCGINGIRGKERTYKFMTVETAVKLARDLRRSQWTARLEFALHGEPTVNPDFLKIVSIFRKQLPRNYFLLETNGGGFLGKTPEEYTQKIISFFDAGLSTVALDEYQHVPWASLVRRNVSIEALAQNQISFYEYPRDKAGSPHSRVAKRRFVIIAPIDLSSAGTHSTLNNHCGSGAPLDASLIHTRCAKPFREVSVRWDGSVSICCNSWDGRGQIGNIVDTPIYELWQSPRFHAIRQKLLHHQRDFEPCFGCTNKSYRTGLLPDKYGKETLPAPDAETERVISEMVALGPLTTPVDRGWSTDRALLQIKTLI